MKVGAPVCGLLESVLKTVGFSPRLKNGQEKVAQPQLLKNCRALARSSLLSHLLSSKICEVFTFGPLSFVALKELFA
jgi:hypothetical protein